MSSPIDVTQPTAAIGTRDLQRNAAKTIRRAVDDAVRAGLDPEDVGEVVDAALGQLDPLGYTAGQVLAKAKERAAAPIEEAGGFRQPTADERGSIVFALPRLDEHAWSEGVPEETEQTLVFPLAALPAYKFKLGEPGYDWLRERDHYAEVVHDVIDRHVAEFGPLRARVEYPPLTLAGDDLKRVSAERWARFNAAHPIEGDLPDDCPDCEEPNTLDRDLMCDSCRRYRETNDAYHVAKEAMA